jgi:type VI secretion system secreted protein Hcp
MAKGDMFLKLDDIKGESADDAHKGEIDVVSWSWNVTQAGSFQVAGSPGSGKAAVQDLTIKKYTCSASNVLLNMCLSGKPIKLGVLTLRKAGGPKPLEFLKISMNNAVITGYSCEGAGGTVEGHTETITINFSSFKHEYTPQKADGSGGPVISMGWDIAGNKPL